MKIFKIPYKVGVCAFSRLVQAFPSSLVQTLWLQSDP